MNNEEEFIIKQILEMVETLLEASEYLQMLVEKNNYVEFDTIVTDMFNMLNKIYITISNFKNQEKVGKSILFCESIIDSLKRINLLAKSRSIKLSQKIEFELIPILQEMYMYLYFWGIVYGDKERMENYYINEMVPLSANKYVDKAENEGKYKYDVSILVLGYNKLEYTKLCMQSLFEHIPKDLNYELILINHGSTDETKEYYESICPTKQLDIFRNGGGGMSPYRITEGKYILTISNDILVTENAISNLIKCMDSDEKIAWVVPTTPNIANYQSIEITYENTDDMYKLAKKNNVSDKFRWEQRTRLCNPIDLIRSKVFVSSNSIGFLGCLHSKDIMSFPDDKLSLLFRRNGYKMILAKDAFCHHYGSVTLSEDVKKHNKAEKDSYYIEGIKKFVEIFGINPWHITNCWNKQLFQFLQCKDTEAVDILGVNCGFGSNPLKIKESIKENSHNLNVKIYNVTDQKCYIEDLKGVSDYVEYINNCSDISKVLKNKKFKYIIFDDNFGEYEKPLDILLKLQERVLKNGIIVVRVLNEKLKTEIKNKYLDVIELEEWIILDSNYEGKIK